MSGEERALQRARIVEVILAAARELNETIDRPIDVALGDAAFLYGRSGVLDSLGLVSLISAVEQLLDERLGLVMSLADERAVSQSASPFRTVGSLADYALRLARNEE